MAIKADRAGAEAMKIPTLLNSRLLMASIKNIFATTSQRPESRANFCHSLLTRMGFLGARIMV
jgi:hypothetical protein